MGKTRNEEFDWEYVFTNWLPRALALVSGAVLWYASIVYSVAGFGYASGGKHEWMGYAIASFGVTTLEIVFNNGHHQGNQTATLLALVAYIYGIGSNVLGIWSDWGAPSQNDPKLWITLVGAATLGFLLEVAPEMLLNIGLGINSSGMDFVNQMARLSQSSGGSRKVSTTSQSYQSNPKTMSVSASMGVRKGGIACPECGSMNTIQTADKLFCAACRNTEHI